MKKILNIIIILLLLLSIVGNVLLLKNNSQKTNLIKTMYGLNYQKNYAKYILKIDFAYNDIKFHKDFSNNFKEIINKEFRQEAYSQHGLDIESLSISPNNEEKTEYLFTIYGTNKELVKDQIEYITSVFIEYINGLQEEIISEEGIVFFDKSTDLENQNISIISLKDNQKSALYYTNIEDFSNNEEVVCRKKIKNIELIKKDYGKIK